MASRTEIVAVSARPDLAPRVAHWLVAAFQAEDGLTEAEMLALIQAPPVGPEESFVLIADGAPAGIASLVRRDLDSRPDLTPWLAGVFVLPEHRGRGFATSLVRHVEEFAAAAGVRRLWLYTNTAEPLYAALGWHRAGLERTRRTGTAVVLMARDLGPARVHAAGGTVPPRLKES